MSEDGLVGTQAASGEPGGYCPNCNQQVTWRAFSLTDSLVQNCLAGAQAGDEDPTCTGRHLASGHYFLGGSLTSFKLHYVGSHYDHANIKDVVLTKDCAVDVCGQTVNVSGGYTLYGMDSSGDGYTIPTGKHFMTDEDTLYTNLEGTTLSGGAEKTGVLISGIMKEERSPELDGACGQMPVFAASYLVLRDGTVILSDDTENHSDDVAYSLYDVMATVDKQIAGDSLNYRKLTNPMISLQTPKYNTFDIPTEMESNKIYPDTLVGYLREQFPKAQLAWHQTWAYAVGTAGNGTVTDAAIACIIEQGHHPLRWCPCCYFA